MKHKALNQLLCAAVVNDRFCQTLLRNPAQALTAGYAGHNFALTSDERDMVLGIRALHLEDFAAQVYRWMTGDERGGRELRWNTVGAPQPAIDLVPVPVLA